MIKIDLVKSFDRLESNFISHALHNFGFSTHFIHLVNICITSPVFSVVINGQPYGSFLAKEAFL